MQRERSCQKRRSIRSIAGEKSTDVENERIALPCVTARRAFNIVSMNTRFLAFFCLSASIATLLVPSGFKSGAISTLPTPAYGDIDPADVQDFAAHDLSRIRGNVVKALTRRSPYLDVLEGGTLDPNISDVQRVVVQERAVLNQSLVAPAFSLDTTICGTTGNAAEVGSTEYTYSLATNRGKGPLVCIKGMWGAFKTAYSAAEQALKAQLIQLNNADVRWTITNRSGCKMVVNTNGSWDDMFSGDVQSIDRPFPTALGLPNAMPTMKLLTYTAQQMREVLGVEAYEGGNNGDMILKVIGEQQMIDYLRDDADVREDYRYMTAGQMKAGSMTLTRYQWEGPYRGLAFGIDPEPLRFNQMADGTATYKYPDGSIIPAGQPVFLEPQITVETDNGVASRPSPTWVRAKYACGVLMGMHSFMKLTPASFTGEGSFKFPSQSVTGELKWRNIEDNDQNVWSDYGRHYYQFSRAYKPVRPHAICSFIYARQQVDFGLTPITNFGDWTSTSPL